MAALFAYGLAIAVGLVIGLILTVVSVFFGQIILFDSIMIAAVTGMVSNRVVGFHPAISLVIGIVLFLFLLWFQNTKVGFWVIGSLLSLFWAFVFGFIAYIFAGEDMIWFYVIMALGFIMMIMLHLKARDH